MRYDSLFAALFLLAQISAPTGIAQYAKGDLGGRAGRGTARMLSATNNHL
jgi:hypothetical protein